MRLRSLHSWTFFPWDFCNRRDKLKRGLFYVASIIFSEYFYFVISSRCWNPVGYFGHHEVGKIWDWNRKGQKWIFRLEVNLALDLVKEWAFLISELFGDLGAGSPHLRPQKDTWWDKWLVLGEALKGGQVVLTLALKRQPHLASGWGHAQWAEGTSFWGCSATSIVLSSCLLWPLSSSCAPSPPWGVQIGGVSGESPVSIGLLSLLGGIHEWEESGTQVSSWRLLCCRKAAFGSNPAYPWGALGGGPGLLLSPNLWGSGPELVCSAGSAVSTQNWRREGGWKGGQEARWRSHIRSTFSSAASSVINLIVWFLTPLSTFSNWLSSNVPKDRFCPLPFKSWKSSFTYLVRWDKIICDLLFISSAHHCYLTSIYKLCSTIWPWVLRYKSIFQI